MSDILPSDLRVLLSQIGAHLQRIDTRLDAIDASVTKLREDVAFVKGRLESIPTFWQSFAIIFGVLIGLPAVATIAVWLLHFSGIL